MDIEHGIKKHGPGFFAVHDITRDFDCKESVFSSVKYG